MINRTNMHRPWKMQLCHLSNRVHLNRTNREFHCRWYLFYQWLWYDILNLFPPLVCKTNHFHTQKQLPVMDYLCCCFPLLVPIRHAVILVLVVQPLLMWAEIYFVYALRKYNVCDIYKKKKTVKRKSKEKGKCL